MSYHFHSYGTYNIHASICLLISSVLQYPQIPFAGVDDKVTAVFVGKLADYFYCMSVFPTFYLPIQTRTSLQVLNALLLV